MKPEDYVRNSIKNRLNKLLENCYDYIDEEVCDNFEDLDKFYERLNSKLTDVERDIM
jgi:hypothetical protein